MDLEQARTYFERVTNQRISNTKLAQALDMKLPNISKKLKEKSKLKQCHLEALERFFCFKMPPNVEKYLNEAPNDYELLEEVIVKVINYFKNNILPIMMTPERKARLIVTIYKMVQYSGYEINDTLIENLTRLMDD